MIHVDSTERRLFWAGAWLVVIGGILTGVVFGLRHGVSFAAGGLLSAANLAVLRHTVNSALRRPNISKIRITAVYIVRLLLILLCLYAMMRFFFFGIISVTAGFAVFSFGIFVEGIFEAFRGSK